MSGGVPGTPLPWAVFHREPRKGVFGEVASDFIHAGPDPKDDTGFNVVARAYTTHGFDGIAEREANAAFIVLACNSHHELIEALEKARLALMAVADSAVEAGFDHLADIIDEQLGFVNRAMDRARGAQS